MNVITITINGVDHKVSPNCTVAAAILNAEGLNSMRRSVTGDPRAALCGMGTCRECEVRVNGISNVRSCMTTCIDGMRVETE
jgi:aerobic-type carbon monoxide dehydrogenase small subunit (CoxS/CutS family)